MATTETDVSVINRALARFGGGEIQSLDENSDLAALCANIYTGKRDYLLSIHPWRFAMAKRQLAKLSDVSPLNEWMFAFALPADMLSGPWAVFGDGQNLSSHFFEIYDGDLYCSYDTVVIDYTRRIDESDWPVWFTDFVATAVAAELAMPVSDQVSKAEMLSLMAYGSKAFAGRGGLFAQCRRLDGQTQTTKTLFSRGDPLTAARFGGVTPPLKGEVL